MNSCEYKKKNEENNEFKLYQVLGNNGAPIVENLNDLIRELRLIFERELVNVDLVKYLMKTYKSNPADWKKFAKFDRYR